MKQSKVQTTLKYINFLRLIEAKFHNGFTISEFIAHSRIHNIGNSLCSGLKRTKNIQEVSFNKYNFTRRVDLTMIEDLRNSRRDYHKYKKDKKALFEKQQMDNDRQTDKSKQEELSLQIPEFIKKEISVTVKRIPDQELINELKLRGFSISKTITETTIY